MSTFCVMNGKPVFWRTLPMPGPLITYPLCPSHFKLSVHRASFLPLFFSPPISGFTPSPDVCELPHIWDLHLAWVCVTLVQQSGFFVCWRDIIKQDKNDKTISNKDNVPCTSDGDTQCVPSNKTKHATRLQGMPVEQTASFSAFRIFFSFWLVAALHWGSSQSVGEHRVCSWGPWDSSSLQWSDSWVGQDLAD